MHLQDDWTSSSSEHQCNHMCHVRCAGPTSACLRLPALRCLQACGKPLPSIHRLHTGSCFFLDFSWGVSSHFGDRNRSFIYVFGIDKAGNSDFTGLKSSLEWLQVPGAVGINPPLHTEKCWKENTPQNLTGDSMQWKLHDQSHRYLQWDYIWRLHKQLDAGCITSIAGNPSSPCWEGTTLASIYLWE